VEAGAPFAKHARRGLALGVAVSAASMLALLAASRQPPEALLASLAGLDLDLVAAAVLLHVGLWLLWAARLQVLARQVGLNLGYGASLRAVLAGSFAASVTPAMLGGEAVRGYALARDERRVGHAGAAILAERLLDMGFFMAGGAAFALLYGKLLTGALGLALMAMGALLAFGLGVVALAALRPAVVRGWCARAAAWAARRDGAKQARWRARAEHEFDQFRAALGVLARRPQALALAALLTFGMWASELGVLWVLLHAFGTPLPFGLVLLAGMLLLLAMTTPLAPGGSGVAELGAAAVFGALAPGLSPFFAVAWRGCTFYMNLVLGGVAAARLWGPRVTAGATAPEAAR
jgi:hypothetical protein